LQPLAAAQPVELTVQFGDLPGERVLGGVELGIVPTK
jgi:hypothetical protein